MIHNGSLALDRCAHIAPRGPVNRAATLRCALPSPPAQFATLKRTHEAVEHDQDTQRCSHGHIVPRHRLPGPDCDADHNGDTVARLSCPWAVPLERLPLERRPGATITLLAGRSTSDWPARILPVLTCEYNMKRMKGYLTVHQSYNKRSPAIQSFLYTTKYHTEEHGGDVDLEIVSPDRLSIAVASARNGRSKILAGKRSRTSKMNLFDAWPESAAA